MYKERDDDRRDDERGENGGSNKKVLSVSIAMLINLMEERRVERDDPRKQNNERSGKE